MDLLRGERGEDLFKCFQDMSLKDAGIICGVGWATLKVIKKQKNMEKWDFHDLRAGKVSQEKWNAIKIHRERMMQVESVNIFQGILHQFIVSMTG